MVASSKTGSTVAKSNVAPTDDPKKRKVEEEVKTPGKVARKEVEEKEEESAPKESEKDAKSDARPALTEQVVFDPAATTLNVLPAHGGRLLTSLTEGGTQYLLAGARANVGIKKGRYLFEVQIVEALNPAESTTGTKWGPKPRQVLRVGVSPAKAELLQCPGGSEDDGVTRGAFFDADGSFYVNGKKQQGVSGAQFSRGHTMGVLLNVEKGSPNVNTLSLFRDGVRVAGPLPLPEAMFSKSLFPHVTFRNVTVRVHMGPQPLAPLPFKCRCWSGAAKEDTFVEQSSAAKAKDGKFEVMMPMGFPDEGTFDWLDGFLAENPKYTELSDRMILDWAAKSGLRKINAQAYLESGDKPVFNFGLPSMDDMSVREVLGAFAAAVPRNYVVMEVKSNLIDKERADILKRFPPLQFKRVAHVVMGEPTAKFKTKQQELLLNAKQEKMDKDLKVKKANKQMKKAAEKRQKALAEQKRQAELNRLKKIAEAKKRADEIKKKAAEKKAAEAGDAKTDDVEDKKDDAKEEDEKAEEEEATQAEETKEEEKKEDEEEESDEEAGIAELTDAEKKTWFRTRPIPDLTASTLNKAFTDFSIPEKTEGFDEIRYEWQKGDKSKDYLKKWVSDRRLTAKVEDLKRGKWFMDKRAAWQKQIIEWKNKLKEFKAMQPKAVVKQDEKKDGDEDDKPKLDIFSLEDLCDTGKGVPLFELFGPEDWAMVQLRCEIHLVITAFPKDCDDASRSIHEDNLPFYYQKYFGKILSAGAYGLKEIKDIYNMVKDTVDINNDTRVVSSTVSEEAEGPDMFVKLAEECRRERQRRLDAGDETARTKFTAAVLQNTDLKAVEPAKAAIIQKTAGGADFKSGAVAAFRAKEGAGGAAAPAPFANKWKQRW